MGKLLKFTKSLINFCIHENKATAAFDASVFKFWERKKCAVLNVSKRREENWKNNKRRTISREGEFVLCSAMRIVKIACNNTLQKKQITHWTDCTVYSVNTSHKRMYTHIVYIYNTEI